ncbi:MAG TPA: CoF synthetase, partial [Candidatus Angelobacter sp.]|nr:CoF synthetase [Candidatus Angelobacter sp.]
FVLSPTADLNPNSSLTRYLSLALTEFGTKGSKSFFTEKGLETESLIETLRNSEKKGEPVLLIGATFAYVHLLDYLREKNFHFSLADSSRIFDTGGFKGQSREVEMDALYQDFNHFFGVPRSLCVNMYGMTELCSQMYDQTIRSHYLSEVIGTDKKGPAWIRTVVLDTNTLKPVERGQVGVLAHYDLANWNACMAILTEDLGYETDKGFVLLGRVEGSEAKGCSIAVDQLLQATKL